MTIEGDELPKVARLFNTQLGHIRTSAQGPLVLVGLNDERYTVEFVSGRIAMHIRTDEPVEFEDHPEWIESHQLPDHHTLICDYSPYHTEVLYLLVDVWRRLRSSDHPDILAELKNALRLLKHRWDTQKEPIGVEKQKGYIGELEAIRSLLDAKKGEAIRGWDHTSHAAHDIEAGAWHIEAKAKSRSSTEVKVSFQKQLEYSDERDLYLSVTDISATMEEGAGLTLAAYVDQLLNEFRSENIEGTEDLESKIACLGITEGLFKTRFSIGETVYYEVPEGSSPDLMARMETPEGTRFSNYKLDLGTLEPIEDLN